ncbi:hypothetical protein B0T26DRAFT_682522 [Lasiosphaeria miniovina]|uniref:Uncharacterized protein n=1 Tax=Lasiosphaeria miniovina TaxID=1954250 RepID=A0AA40ED30_9PEZI|nr:uncharacterized protein B0T26DRAFT_682522 [Lasiosphaeria miniovina]KAK0732981.1 hypothetical protein B0T26DRAFT_682522 [Lasiosphaeria miniovina]
MCTSYYIKYTCQCKEMEFVQCEERQGTNVRCTPVTKRHRKDAQNFCESHLVYSNTPRTYITEPKPQDAEQ